jgi:integrase
MAVYRPTYTDHNTGQRKQQGVWWYHFTFAGRRIQESSKSTRKTIALSAEKERRLELERTFNSIEDRRKDRIRPMGEIADAYLVEYKARHKSVTFAEHAIRHIKRLLGSVLTADVSDSTIKDYQTARLNEKAAPKTINEEVGFALRLLEDQGDVIRVKMRRKKTLRLQVGPQTARAFTPKEKAAMIAEARNRRSPHIVPALALALHAGLRDAEIRGLQWQRLDLQRAILTVGASKSDAGAGRTIPLNADLLAALEIGRAHV